ncbi:hypothetical protein CEE45_16920 [Candidatus Heimdallarchaeota archaeon B3_Heim]|nr:MAG: hypothetical protein CEE45_16920 [Candidatus Heimdallarchaeota archaeon B3_Heim]
MNVFDDLKKPFNVFLVVMAVVGWIINAYFFFKSERIRGPTYLVSSEINKVYDSKKVSPKLILLKTPGEKIEKDVFLVTVHFWNSGKLPIEPQDIREPVKFTIRNCEEIVDYNVISETNPEITDFRVSPGGDRKSLILNWAHLDPKNGAKFQVFYTGPPNPEYLFTGNILGSTVFLDGRSLGKRVQRTKLGAVLVSVVVGAGSGLLGWWGSTLYVDVKLRRRKGIHVRVAIFLAALSGYLLFIYVMLLTSGKIPPV